MAERMSQYDMNLETMATERVKSLAAENLDYNFKFVSASAYRAVRHNIKTQKALKEAILVMMCF